MAAAKVSILLYRRSTPTRQSLRLAAPQRTGLRER
jgi:hypothetical protein